MLPLVVRGASEELVKQLVDFGFDVKENEEGKMTAENITSAYAVVLVVDHVTPAVLCTAVFNLGTIAAFGKPVFVMWRPRQDTEGFFDPSDVISQAKNVSLTYSMEGLLNTLVFSLLSKLEFKKAEPESRPIESGPIGDAAK